MGSGGNIKGSSGMSMTYLDSSYRKQSCCGNCENCVRDTDSDSGICELVDEEVSIFGYCNKHVYCFPEGGGL
jgi:hypothetical protein